MHDAQSNSENELAQNKDDLERVRDEEARHENLLQAAKLKNKELTR